MLKSKRFNGSMAAVVVLAVILAVAVTAGATLAWFASQDSATTNFELGDSVVVAITDEDSTDITTLDIVVPAAYLVPGMQIFPQVYADITSSTTSALLRAKVDVLAEWDVAPSEIPAGWTYSDGHYTDGTNNVTATEGDLETLYAYIVETHLMTNFIQKANGWYHDSDVSLGDYFYFVGNGEAYSMGMTAVANTSDLNNVVYAQYSPAGVGAPYADNTNDTGLLDPDGESALTADYLASIVTLAESNADGDLYNDGWVADFAHVPFLVRPITIPVAWGNAVANASITISIQFEAIQDYLVDPATANADVLTVQLPSLANAKAVFQSALILNPSV